MQESSKNLIIINVASFVMSFSALFAQWISLESYSIIFGRSLTATPLLILACLVMGVVQKIQSKTHGILIFISGILITSHWVFFYMAIQVSSVAIGVISLFSYPLITSLIEPVFTKVKFQLRTIISSVILVLGIGILSGHNLAQGSLVLGIGLGIVAALSFAIRNIIMKKIVHSYSPVWLMCLQTALSLVILTPFSMTSFFNASSQNILLTISVGVVVIAFAHTLFVQSMRTLSATSVGIIASLQLVYSVLSSWYFLNEPISIHIIIGGFLIMTVAILEQFKTNT